MSARTHPLDSRPSELMAAGLSGMMLSMDSGATTDLVARGEEALVSGDWSGAREAFQAAVDSGGTPDALDGQGRAVWWLGDVDRAIECRERERV
jgi:hypothetical protein